MHVDANYPEFQKFIDQAEKDLDLKIHIVSYPENADNRQAEVSTILSAGEDSVDIFSVNDEMVSEFKYKGYLEPLNDTVMTEDILSCYPESIWSISLCWTGRCILCHIIWILWYSGSIKA